MSLMIAVPRRLVEGAAMIRSGAFKGWSPTHMLGHRFTGKRLGIIGMGRIGLAVAKRARGFGLSIHYHNRRRLQAEIENEVEATYWESLDQMLARVDIVTVHCPHTPATFHLLSDRRLKLLKPNAVLINMARDEIVDEAALVRLLEQSQIAGAGLDVFAHEPGVNAKLLALPNVVLLPHMGSATFEGRLAMGDKVIINIRAFADGHALPDRVLPAHH
jgi:glyoxylate reductase